MTDGCPICFGASLQSLAEPIALSAVYVSRPPETMITILMDQEMDTTVLPATSSFDLIVSGISRPVGNVSWTDGTHFLIESGPGDAPGDPVVIDFPVEDANFRSIHLLLASTFSNLVATG